MTKEQVIQRMQNAPTDHAYYVITMNEEDVRMYGSEELQKRFFALPPEKRMAVMHHMLDEVMSTFEEGDNWGFGNCFRQTEYEMTTTGMMEE